MQACPPSTTYRFSKFARRNKTLLAMGITLAVGIVTVVGSLSGAVYVLMASNAEVNTEQQQTKSALSREKQTNDQLVRALDRVQWTQYFQRIALADREGEARNIGRAEELLEDCPPEFRGWEWHYLKRRNRQELLLFRGHAGLISSAAISPDGKVIASTGLIVGTAGIQLGEIRLWDRTTGKQIHRLLEHHGPVAVAFHPDGKRLISGGTDNTLRVWDVVTGNEIRNLKVPERIHNLAVSIDGTVLITVGSDNVLRIRNGEDLQEIGTLRGHTGFVHATAFGPDQRLVTGSFDGTVRIWDVKARREVHVLRGHAGPVFGAAFSRDGAMVASSGLDGTLRVWDAHTGKHLHTTRTEDLGTISVAFSPDSKRLATGSLEKVIRVWDLQADKEVLTLRGHSDAIWALAFSRDGDQLVSGSLDGTVRVWDGTPLGAAPSRASAPCAVIPARCWV